MKENFFNLFGISEMKKEIQDLKIQINTLKEEATNTYEIYENAFLFIKDLNLNKDNDWWENKDFTNFNDDFDSMIIRHKIRKQKRIEFIKKNPSLKIKKIYHGGCLSCITPLEKGLNTCLGCQYLMGWDYKDLSTKK